MSAPPSRRPLWPTLLVLVGSVALVALFLSTLGDRTADGPDPAATADAATTTQPSAGPTPSPQAGAEPSAQPRATASSSPAPTLDPALIVPVVVVNQTQGQGLAARAAAAIDAGGWTVDSVQQAALDAPSTTVYVPEGLEASAEAFLRTFPAVTRQRPAFTGLATEGLTLVLAEPDAAAVVLALEEQQRR